MEFFYGHYNYWVVVFLMMLGLYITISRSNMVKILVGLTLFQTSVFIFYISLGKITGGTAPILVAEEVVYSNPLTSVLILTAIVVSIATTALGLAIVVRIKESYGTIDEEEIDAIERNSTEVPEPVRS
jgi:multicomponent Na+:H+ antiporter subunit C